MLNFKRVFILLIIIGCLVFAYQTYQNRGDAYFESNDIAAVEVTSPEDYILDKYQEEDAFDTLLEAENKPQTACDVLETPNPMRAVYMSSWVAGSPGVRSGLVNQIERTDLNAVVIDVKDVNGNIMIPVESPGVIESGAYVPERTEDLADFVLSLCEKGIFPIARIAIFKDQIYVKQFPDQAVQYEDGRLWWGDGGHWVSPASVQYWEYMVDLARASKEIGFGEINFDYIRYPSRGNLEAAVYPGRGERTKSEVIVDLLDYFDKNLRRKGFDISVDIFGMSLTDPYDVGIGQYLEDFVPYVDFIAPMVYPSHYYSGFFGLDNPAANPYPVVYLSVGRGVERLEELGVVATSTLRPWLQDFSFGGVYYSSNEVDAQINALRDLGIESWILWDSQNTYHYEKTGTTSIDY